MSTLESLTQDARQEYIDSQLPEFDCEVCEQTIKYASNDQMWDHIEECDLKAALARREETLFDWLDAIHPDLVAEIESSSFTVGDVVHENPDLEATDLFVILEDHHACIAIAEMFEEV